MFTGLIEEVGTIHSISHHADSARIVVQGAMVSHDLKVDDSIAVNGCCLTVTEIDEQRFVVVAVRETLSKTTLGTFIVQDKVNLERALLPTTRLGGHFVQGHVDTVGIVESVDLREAGRELWISFPAPYRKWLIPAGSICVDGVSLTTASVEESRFKVALIPHTVQATTLGALKDGDKVNLEFDVLAKYMENFVSP
jgi:riboflavin synthase